MQDEWTKVISGDRLVKFTYFDLPTGAAFMTAQIAVMKSFTRQFHRRENAPSSRVGAPGPASVACRVQKETDISLDRC